ncbi:MAG TPA: hypothetical protein VJ904_12770 [Tichowtungia sp.]|nr:hypothetical protein [Tichowtungia sp.]HKL26149.1 hypothetical protein [Desulfuromonadales bacterium]
MKNTVSASLLLLIVASGLAFAAFIGDTAASVDLMNILFIGFAGAIIAVQLIPSYQMLRRIFNGLLNPSGRGISRKL